jgi:uncharacterized coiled-coil protein SlyX
MHDREANKIKLEADLKAVEAKLLEMRAAAKAMPAEAQIEFNKRVEQLEDKVTASRARLNEFGDATEETWKSMKAGMESAWHSITDSVKEAFDESNQPPKT